jgi:peptidyl-prolyl cis-trans isomerase SurA
MKQSARANRSARLGAIALLLLLLVGPLHAQEKLVDGIAAQVDGDIVLVSEVMELAGPVEQKMREGGAPEAQIAMMRAQVLERLIEQHLIASLVRRLELEATDAEIDRAIGGIAEDTGLTMRQLAESVQSHGLTFEEYRAKIGSEIERSKILNSLVRSQVRVEPEEVEALYKERYSKQRSGGEEILLSHYVVAAGPEYMRDQVTACAIAEEGAKRIRSGEFTFEEVARRMSDSDPQRGGNLGWVHTSDLAGWMVPVVSGLEPGEVSEVIENPYGCNVLLIRERRSFEPVSFEDASPELEAELTRIRSEERYVEWLEKLRAQAYIERKGVFAATQRSRTQ